MSPRRAERGVLHYLLLGINVGVFVLVAAIAALVLIIPAATGSVALTVLTGSMEPGLPPGSMVVVKPTDPADVRIGSIITYQWEPGEPALVTHRVTEVVSNSDGTFTWTTQGDNNSEPDPNPVTQEQLRGVVWYSLPLVGWVSNLVAGDLRPILVPVIGGALLVYAAVLVVQSLRGRRKAAGGDAEASAEAPRERGRQSRPSQGRRAATAESAAPVTAPAEPVAESVPTTTDWFAVPSGAAASPPGIGTEQASDVAAPVIAEVPAEPAERPTATPDAAGPLPERAADPGRTAEPGRAAEPAAPLRRRERSSRPGSARVPEEGPRRSTYIPPEPSEQPMSRRARRAAEPPGTGLDSFIAPVSEPSEPEGAAPVRDDAPSPSGPPAEQEPLRRPRGRGRSYR